MILGSYATGSTRVPLAQAKAPRAVPVGSGGVDIKKHDAMVQSPLFSFVQLSWPDFGFWGSFLSKRKVVASGLTSFLTWHQAGPKIALSSRDQSSVVLSFHVGSPMSQPLLLGLSPGP